MIDWSFSLILNGTGIYKQIKPHTIILMLHVYLHDVSTAVHNTIPVWVHRMLSVVFIYWPIKKTYFMPR